ncbi:ATP-grasp domain-containing protein [Streptomyces sp. TRM70308]|uniref:ATP-grasp domain-containing protein n=1 Tax=Streptomyces sp. TRM70308 TaxID=3131932 RepID=UPI003D0333F7
MRPNDPSPVPSASAAFPSAREPEDPRPVTLEGVALDEGTAHLERLADEIVFLDRSAFLPASCRPATGLVRHVPVSPLLTAPPPPQPAHRAGGRTVAVAFAPEHGDHATAWTRRHGIPLLAPPAGITARASDKIRSLELLAEAGVAVPEHVVIPAERQPSAAHWPDGWDAAVLQRRENNLAGRGTVRVDAPEALPAALDAWAGHTLRLSRLVPGLPLTVSACAGADRTVVSAVSHQLVGLPELTPGWGTHCGNQLLDDSDLPAPLLARVRETARAVGDVLRRHGFRGVFGLDLVVGDGVPLVVEINPRFQTVASLAQAAETAAGLLPLLGLHVLACLLPELPPARARTGPVPRLGQLVVHARRPGHVVRLPRPGHYRLTEEGPLELLEPLDRAGAFDETALPVPLPQQEAGTALLWPHASPGPVLPGDELALVQTGHHLCDVSPRPTLGPPARSWTDRILTHEMRTAAGERV